MSWAPGGGPCPELGKKAVCRSLNVGTKDGEGGGDASFFEPACFGKVGNIAFCFCVEFGITLLSKHLTYALLVLGNSTSASQICAYACLYLHVFLVPAFLDLLFSGRYFCIHSSGPGSNSLSFVTFSQLCQMITPSSRFRSWVVCAFGVGCLSFILWGGLEQTGGPGTLKALVFISRARDTKPMTGNLSRRRVELTAVCQYRRRRGR